MRKKIVFLLAFLCMLFMAGCSNGKETSKYNIEYLNKDKTGIAEMPYDASAATTDALIEEFFAPLPKICSHHHTTQCNSVGCGH
jgi:germination protein M